MKIIFADSERVYEGNDEQIILKTFELIKNVMEDTQTNIVYLNTDLDSSKITRTIFEELLLRIILDKPISEYERIANYLLADADVIYKHPICTQKAIELGSYLKLNYIMRKILERKSPNRIDCIKLIWKDNDVSGIDFSTMAIQYDDYEFMKYILSMPHILFGHEIKKIIREEKNNCLRCIHEHYFLRDFTRTYDDCNMFSDISMREYIRAIQKNGYALTKLICNMAAHLGKYNALKYAHENGCPMDVTTCIVSARNGNYKCLKYAHDHGCKFNAKVYLAATLSDDVKCLEYLHGNGCIIGSAFGTPESGAKD